VHVLHFNIWLFVFDFKSCGVTQVILAFKLLSYLLFFHIKMFVLSNSSFIG